MSDARPHVDLWQAPDLGAELLAGRFSGFSYDLHTHDTACFALITHGSIRIRMRGAEFTATRGDLYAIEADELHAGWPVDGTGWSQRTMYVDRGQLLSVLGDVLSRHGGGRMMGPIIRDRRLSLLFHGLHRCSQSDGPPLKRQVAYAGFAQRFFERHVQQSRELTTPSAEPDAVRRAREFLDARLDIRVSLQEVAAASGLPPFRLLRAFERQLGISPHAYQRLARLRHARRQIRDGMPLSRVATEAGFADQAHLTRAFKSAFGLPPGAYRQAYRQ